MRGGEVRLAVVPSALGYGARGARLQLPPSRQEQGGEGGGASKGGRAGTVSIPGNAKLYYQVRPIALFLRRCCVCPEDKCAHGRVARQTSAPPHGTVGPGTWHAARVRSAARPACTCLFYALAAASVSLRGTGWCNGASQPRPAVFLRSPPAPPPPLVYNPLHHQGPHPHVMCSPGWNRRLRCFAARAWRAGWPAARTTRTHAYERRRQGSSRANRGKGKGRRSGVDGGGELGCWQRGGG